MVEALALPDAIELAEKIKKSYRARWDEVRFQDEATGEVTPTQYDLTLELKGGKETLNFSFREIEGQRRWHFQMFVESAFGSSEWVSRHDRETKWVVVPEMLATALWDIVTVHGDDATKRGWSEIDRKDISPEPVEEKV